MRNQDDPTLEAQQLRSPGALNPIDNTNFTEQGPHPEPARETNEIKSKSSRSSVTQFTWRICLSSGSEFSDVNSLISPWKWTGTVKYVHEECLKAWLNWKREDKETAYSHTYHWKNLTWELCKSVYPEVWYVLTATKSKINQVFIKFYFWIKKSMNLEYLLFLILNQFMWNKI